MKKNLILLAMALCCSGAAFAQTMPENSDDRVAIYRTMQNVRNVLNIPDIPGYLTLKCDFHLHTVFADAQVSPAGRVQESWYD